MPARRQADVIIVGGGPAGLSAALVLGRCRRTVVVLDDRRPRNQRSLAVHGFFTRDGTPPAELLRIGREQLRPYAVTVIRATATHARRRRHGFEVVTSSGTRYRARKLVLATGLTDQLPKVAGIEPLYGRTVFHCPYCDGWEWRDRALAVLGSGDTIVRYALGLTVWSRDLLVCTNGVTRLSAAARSDLRAHAIRIRMEPIVRLEARHGRLERIVFAEGPSVARQALFFCAPTMQRSPLVAELGCELTRDGSVKTGKLERAGRGGLFVVGDASEDVNFVAVAAAEGVKAAVAINKELCAEDARPARP